MKFGAFLKERRTAASWSQKQVADKIGCTEAYVSALELGRKLPSHECCANLANVFGESRSEWWTRMEEEKATIARVRIEARRDTIRRGAQTLGLGSKKFVEEPVVEAIRVGFENVARALLEVADALRKLKDS